MLETRVDNFDTADEANAFMGSSQFMENLIRTDFDPEDLIGKLKGRVEEKELKKRVEIRPRIFPPGF